MGLENAKAGKLLYHLTEFGNLPSIIEYGLQSRAQLKRMGLRFDDVADPEILNGRRMLGLEEYIPFHFHPYSAFDVAVKNVHYGDVMVYICIHRDYAKNNEFKILPRHPLAISGESIQLYDYDEGFDKIDWNILSKVGSLEEGAKNIKMAECLAGFAIPPEDFFSIAVANEEDKILVEELLENKNINFPPPFVNIQEAWFI